MILIEGCKHTKEQEIAIMKAAHSALFETFKVTLEAINTRLLVHEPHRFSAHAHCNPDCYVFISIDCFMGRSLTTKSYLYQVIGGFAGCDLDVGYKVEV